MTATSPGPRCTICTHAARQSIDSALTTGVELATISGRFDVSTSALSRHAQSHLSRELRDAAADSDFSPTSLLLRLGEIADDARAARLRAQEGGTPTQQARATDIELKAINTLMATYGIDSTETLETLKAAEQLTHGVAKFCIANPIASRDLLTAIRNEDLSEFADQLQALVTKKNPRIERAQS